MYKNKSVGVVVPSYNEESQISRVISTMPEYVDYIIVIDDCSQDATVRVVNELSNQNEKVTLIKHEANQGVGGAIATGYIWCRDYDIDIAVVMAGDGQMDPKDLPAILEPVVSGEADYSKANRLTSGDAYKNIPKVRYLGNSMLTLLTKIATGYWHVTDSQTGYTAINQKALKTIDWSKMYKRYGQPNDLLAKLNVYRFKVKDVVTEPVYNVGEKSNIKVRKVIFTIGWLLVKLFFWRLKEKYIIRDFHPLVFFYLMSFLLMLLALGFFVSLVIKWFLDGYVPHMTALLVMFTSITGLQFGFFAMWMDSDYNRDLHA